MATTERRILVTDFAALRCGVLVEVGPCGGCGKWLRGILTSFSASGWDILPEHVCPPGTPRCLGANDVGRRCVYRIIDDLDEEADRALMRVVESGADLLAQGRKVRP